MEAENAGRNAEVGDTRGAIRSPPTFARGILPQRAITGAPAMNVAAQPGTSEAEPVSGSWTWDVCSAAIEFSDSLLRIYHITPEQLRHSGSGYLASIHPADRDRVRLAVSRGLVSGNLFHFHYRIVRDDGGQRLLVARARVQRDPSKFPVRVIATCQSVIKHRTADRSAEPPCQQPQPEIIRRLDEIEQVERRRIARDLHDTVGKSVTLLGIALNAIALRLQLGGDREGLCRVTEAIAAVEQIGAATRNVITELRPRVLEEFGLAAALRAESLHAARLSAVTVRYRGPNSVCRLPPYAEVTMLRIAQEALANALKHARAVQVSIMLTELAGGLELAIVDDGRGFDLQAGRSKCGLGLSTMRERAEAIGARFSLESALGGGTRVRVEYSYGVTG